MRKENISPRGEVAVSPIPWHVLIWDDYSSHTCGGVILDHLTILTASRCFDFFETELLKRKNASNSNINFFQIHISTGSTRRKAGQTLGLRYYKSDFKDVVLLKLTVAIELGYYSQPACLPSSEKSVSFKQCYYCGWNEQDKLRWYQINFNQDKCSRLKGFDPSKQLCISQDVLNDRDSGGALVCMKDYIPVIAAIATGNRVFPGNKRAGIFTKILPNLASDLKHLLYVQQVDYPGAMCSSMYQGNYNFSSIQRYVLIIGKLPAFMRNGQRIVNGEKAPKPIPWQIFYYGIDRRHSHDVPRCGGTILDRRTILTAAHCIGYWYSWKELPLLVIAGSTNRLEYKKPNQAIKVEKIVQYVPDDPYNR